MKKFFIIVGGIAAASFFGLVFYIGFIFLTSQDFDSGSKEWMDTHVPKIIETWDIGFFERHLSPQYEEATNEKELEEFFKTLNEVLGVFIAYESSSGEAGVSIYNGKKTFTAEYEARATFEEGPVIIKVGLLQLNEGWSIRSFYVTATGELGEILEERLR